MGKNPNIVYANDEGVMTKEAMHKYLRHGNMEHHRTMAQLNFSERAIPTFKAMLHISVGMFPLILGLTMSPDFPIKDC